MNLRQYWFDWIGFLADDVRYLTDGWDDLLREHGELLVYGPDGYQNERMATHPFVRKAIPETLGYLLPRELVHGCPDTFLEALARQVGSIAYDPRITIEHLHPDAGKADMDQTYMDALKHWPNDRKTFDEIIKPTIPALAVKLESHLPKP